MGKGKVMMSEKVKASRISGIASLFLSDSTSLKNEKILPLDFATLIVLPLSRILTW